MEAKELRHSLRLKQKLATQIPSNLEDGAAISAKQSSPVKKKFGIHGVRKTRKNFATILDIPVDIMHEVHMFYHNLRVYSR
jgi:hypothetical protein